MTLIVVLQVFLQTCGVEGLPVAASGSRSMCACEHLARAADARGRVIDLGVAAGGRLRIRQLVAVHAVAADVRSAVDVPGAAARGRVAPLAPQISLAADVTAARVRLPVAADVRRRPVASQSNRVECALRASLSHQDRER